METPSVLELNPDIINNRTETYSSLTDIYGIPIFNSSFKQKIEEYQIEQDMQKQQTEQQLFIEDMKAITSDYEQVKEQLFMQMPNIVLKNNNETVKASPILSMSVFGIMIMLFVISIIKIRNQKRKKRIKSYVDIDDRGKETRN